jgi:hypothetical protein
MISPSAGYCTFFKVRTAECRRAVQKKLQHSKYNVHYHVPPYVFYFILFYSTTMSPLMYSILFYSILFYSILIPQCGITHSISSIQVGSSKNSRLISWIWMTPSCCACVTKFIAKYHLYTTIVVYRRYFAIKFITHAQRDDIIQIQDKSQSGMLHLPLQDDEN